MAIIKRLTPEEAALNFRHYRPRTTYPLHSMIGPLDIMEYQSNHLIINVCAHGRTAFPSFLIKELHGGRRVILWFKEGSLQSIERALERQRLVGYHDRHRIMVDANIPPSRTRPEYSLVSLKRLIIRR